MKMMKMLNNIKHIYITDETRNEYLALKDCEHKEIWFVQYYGGQNNHQDYPYADGSIIAAIDANDEFLVLEEFRDIITQFIRIKQRKNKLERINESRR